MHMYLHAYGSHVAAVNTDAGSVEEERGGREEKFCNSSALNGYCILYVQIQELCERDFLLLSEPHRTERLRK